MKDFWIVVPIKLSFQAWRANFEQDASIERRYEWSDCRLFERHFAIFTSDFEARVFHRL
jgi:hypothetical protein